MQLSIFDFMYEKFKITKPIKLIELFAGYGSQALALKYLNVKFEHHKICEWAIKSIQAYKDLHIVDDIDYSKNLTIDQVKDFLYERGISSNYNEPMNKEQINRLSEKQTKIIYNNIIATHNLVNIQKVHAKDLEINDDNFIYLMTYSFPCQDLSLSGKGKGMKKESGTRSGMLWEVERILKECDKLPNVLLMENVPQVHSVENVNDFNDWQKCLEDLGYKNYFDDLKATNYGIPQIRNRCFMVSVLGDYSYTFPKKQKLNLKLKDLLEENVDEKYLLSDKMLNGMLNTKFNSYKLETRLQDVNGNADTLTTATGARCPHIIPIFNNTKEGFSLAHEGYGVDISTRMKFHRGTVQKEKCQTLTTSGGKSVGIVIKENYIQWKEKGRLDIDCRAYFDDKVAPTTTTTTTPKSKVLLGDLRIRRLTPKECWRLMGVKDEDFEKAAINQSETSLYHLAGDSIVVNVLMAIFKEMLEE